MRPVPPGARFALAGAVLAAVAGGVLAATQDGERPGTRTLVAAVAPAPGQLPRFEELAGRAGIAIRHGATGCSGNVAGAAWADVNRDGLLDLFLPQYGGRAGCGSHAAGPTASAWRSPAAGSPTQASRRARCSLTTTTTTTRISTS